MKSSAGAISAIIHSDTILSASFSPMLLRSLGDVLHFSDLLRSSLSTTYTDEDHEVWGDTPGRGRCTRYGEMHEVWGDA